MSKFVMLKFWNHSTTTSNNTVTYYKTLEEGWENLGLKKTQKMIKIFKKLEKKLWKLV